MAAIFEVRTLGKVVLYSLLSGVGIAVIFGIGVASAASFADALRERRGVATVAWGALALACAAGTIGAIVVGLLVMTTK